MRVAHVGCLMEAIASLSPSQPTVKHVCKNGGQYYSGLAFQVCGPSGNFLNSAGTHFSRVMLHIRSHSLVIVWAIFMEGDVPASLSTSGVFALQTSPSRNIHPSAGHLDNDSFPPESSLLRVCGFHYGHAVNLAHTNPIRFLYA